jgi:hypothetical protein
MDRTDFFRDVLISLLARYDGQRYHYGEVANRLIVDRNGRHFLVVTEGWEGEAHVHHILIHLELSGGKIRLVRNGTERDLEAELMEHGVLPSEIVPAFLPPSLRPLTDYAAA